MQSTRCPGQILMKRTCLGQIFEKILKHGNLAKTRPVGTELFHVDGQTARQTWRS